MKNKICLLAVLTILLIPSSGLTQERENPFRSYRECIDYVDLIHSTAKDRDNGIDLDTEVRHLTDGAAQVHSSGVWTARAARSFVAGIYSDADSAEVMEAKLIQFCDSQFPNKKEK